MNYQRRKPIRRRQSGHSDYVKPGVWFPTVALAGLARVGHQPALTNDCFYEDSFVKLS